MKAPALVFLCVVIASLACVVCLGFFIHPKFENSVGSGDSLEEFRELIGSDRSLLHFPVEKEFTWKRKEMYFGPVRMASSLSVEGQLRLEDIERWVQNSPIKKEFIDHFPQTYGFENQQSHIHLLIKNDGLFELDITEK